MAPGRKKRKPNEPEHIVRTLMTVEEVPDGRGGTILNCRCPRTERGCTLRAHGEGIYQTKKGIGFTNPLNHLKACFGSEEVLMDAYKEARNAKQASFTRHFQAVPGQLAVASPTDRTKIHWVKLIVLENNPPGIVEKEHYRRVINTDPSTAISRKTIIDVLLKLKEMTEEAIAKEIQESPCGIVMQDAWSKCSIHYVGTFAGYTKQVPVIRNGASVTEHVPKLTLLSVAPMRSIDSNSDAATNFKAETMASHFRSILEQAYQIRLDKWMVALVADNTSANIRCASLMNVKFVGCKNHQFNLDVKDAINNTAALKVMFANIQSIMLKLKNLKNAAAMRNQTDLRPVLDCATRWTAKFQSAMRFVRLSQVILDMATDEFSGISETNMDVDPAEIRQLKDQATKATKWLKHVQTVTLLLQRRLCTLAACRDVLDLFARKVLKNRTDPHSDFYRCPVELNRCAPSNTALAPDIDFERGVIKIQNKKWYALTDAEEEACACLLKPAAPGSDTDDAGAATSAADGPSSPSLVDQIKQADHERSVGIDGTSPYVNCDFIYGSTAEVERLWSMARYILSTQRQRTSPMIFECLLFLRVNEEYWNDDAFILEAVHHAAADRADERWERKMAELTLEEDINRDLEMLDAFGSDDEDDLDEW
jgi:hypothetical protein